MDCGDDEVVGLGDVLLESILAIGDPSAHTERDTLPVLFSTHIAFFFRSMHRGPARVEVIVDGGT